MQSTITARFDSADEADRAVARLRRAVPYLQAKVESSRRGSLPSQAPMTASVYYPWRINMTLNDQGPRNTELGSRVLYTSDLMGLPLYHDGETEVRLKTDPKDAERVRGLLLNMGGSNIRVS